MNLVLAATWGRALPWVLVALVAVSIVPGRSTPLQGGVHLSILGAYLVLAVIP